MKCEFSNSNKFIFINDGAIFSFLILVEVVLFTDIVRYRPSLSQTAQEDRFLKVSFLFLPKKSCLRFPLKNSWKLEVRSWKWEVGSWKTLLGFRSFEQDMTWLMYIL